MPEFPASSPAFRRRFRDEGARARRLLDLRRPEGFRRPRCAAIAPVTHDMSIAPDARA